MDSACIVANWDLQVAGQITPGAYKFFERVFLQRWILLEKFVQVVNVCLKMTVVVQMHGLFVNEGLQSVICIWERRVYKRVAAVHVRPP